MRPDDRSVLESPAAVVRVLIPDPINLGPGKVRLLAAIRASGSISAAARRMKISYRRAWLMLDALNKACPGGVVDATAGGVGGGGARLTTLGEEILDRYESIQRLAQQAVAGEVSELVACIRRAGAT
ncbi:MAG TPA: LysR family transcriptional regulator [Thiobacillaceae bacterium]|nr:LysR family transcriptional regulator [Thiobacillaceae bacterium]